MNNLNSSNKLIYYTKYFSWFFGCALIIILYGLYRCYNTNFVDPFAKSFVNNNILNKYLDGWGILHLFFYMLLTYLYPERWFLTWIIGVVWEVIELSSKDKPFYMPDCFYTSKDNTKGPWWYGRYEDIIMNTLGGAIGYLIAYLVK